MYKNNLDVCRDKPACKGFDDVIRPKSLAVAYIPMQIICSLYSPCEALVNGTVFPELNKPYKMPFGQAAPLKTDCGKKPISNGCMCHK